MKKLAVLMSHAIQYQAPLLRKLAARSDIRTHVYFFWDFGVKETYDTEFGRTVKWDIPVLEGYEHSFLRNFSPKPSPSFFGEVNFGVIPEIARGEYDAILVFGWSLCSNWLAVLAARATGKGIILHAETPMSQEAGKAGWRQAARRMALGWLFKRVSAFLYIGAENKRFFEHFKVPPEKLFFAPYAVDNARYFKEADALRGRKPDLKRAAGIGEEEPVILFVGKLIEKKRPMDLLKAYEVLVSSAAGSGGSSSPGPTPCLAFVGDGPSRGDLERYAAARGLTNVRFLGFKNQLELPSCYALADVFVLPSGIGETWGLVVNEAMCFGLPVVVSDMVGCAADLVLPGENGFRFPLGNTDQLARCLAELLRDEAKRDRFGTRSREIVARYSHEQDVEAIVQAISSL